MSTLLARVRPTAEGPTSCSWLATPPVITNKMITEFLDKYPMSGLAGKSVPADVVAAYLFLAHDHHPVTEEPIVNSVELEAFIREYVEV